MKQPKNRSSSKTKGAVPPPNSTVSVSAVETALSRDDLDALIKAKQENGQTKETPEAQPTRPRRRKGPSKKSTTTPTSTSTSNKTCPTKRSSSFDSDKWEKRVSTQYEIRNNKSGLCVAGDAPSSSTVQSSSSPRLTEAEVAALAKEQQRHLVAPANDDSSTVNATAHSNNSRNGNMRHASDDEILPGAFRMNPTVGATSAHDYDASDDYPADMNDSSRRHHHHHQMSGSSGRRASQSRRSSMTDRSDKDHINNTTTGLLLEDTGQNNILIEATLVAGDEAEGPPTVVPEPELVTAQPMMTPDKETFADEDGTELLHQQRKRYRWAIGSLLCLLITFLVVAGSVLGVQFRKTSEDHDEGDGTISNDQLSLDSGSSNPLDDVPLTRNVLPTVTQKALEDPSSPQSKAYQWYEQDFKIDQEGPNPSDITSYFPLQRFALATFYYATKGSGWAEDDAWLEDGTDPCDWHTTFFGTICTAPVRRRQQLRRRRRQLRSEPRRHYQRLSLFKNNLMGTLPPELAVLSQLDVVNLHENFIEGAIPSEFGLWQHVTLLQLFNNSLSSSLPTELGQLSQIRQLNFAFNSLSGSLPTELARLTTMEVFSVSNNQISGVIPTEFGRLHQLEGLYLYENPNLGGSLPSELALLTNLLTLQINNVPNLTGGIPSELGLLNNLQEIQLQHTGISGSIPSSLGLLSQLTRLALEDTGLTGTVPVEVCALKDTGALQKISINCSQLKCSCKCDCSASVDNKAQYSMTPTPTTEAPAAPELVEGPPILTSAEVDGEGDDPSPP